MNNELNDNKIDQILAQLGKESRPTGEFQKALLQKVKGQFKETYGHKPSIFNIFRFKLQFASIFSVLILTSTTIYAYNNDAIVEGSVLYPLKRGAETVEGYFAQDEESKSNFYSKLAERRSRELNYLDVQSDQYETTLKETQKMIVLAKVEINQIETADTGTTVGPSTNTATQPLNFAPINSTIQNQAIIQQVIRPATKIEAISTTSTDSREDSTTSSSTTTATGGASMGASRLNQNSAVTIKALPITAEKLQVKMPVSGELIQFKPKTEPKTEIKTEIQEVLNTTVKQPIIQLKKMDNDAATKLNTSTTSASTGTASTRATLTTNTANLKLRIQKVELQVMQLETVRTNLLRK